MLSSLIITLLFFQGLLSGGNSLTSATKTNSQTNNEKGPKERLECIDGWEDAMSWRPSPPWTVVSTSSFLPGVLRNKFDPTDYGIWYKEGPGNLFVLTDLEPYLDMQPIYLYIRYYTHVYSDSGHAIAFPSFPNEASDGDHYKYLPATQDFVWGQTVVQLDPAFIERGFSAGIGELGFGEDEYFVVEKIILAQGFNLTTIDKIGEIKALCGWEEPQVPSTTTEATTPETGGFVCTAVGTFPDPQDCHKFHICQRLDSGEFWDTEITCPDFTVFCEVSGVCENPVVCPCKSTL